MQSLLTAPAVTVSGKTAFPQTKGLSLSAQPSGPLNTQKQEANREPYTTVRTEPSTALDTIIPALTQKPKVLNLGEMGSHWGRGDF